MKILDVYLSEVGRHLPSKSRADIEAEIRSTLNDMLEERSQTSGNPIDDGLTLEVLKEYGSPEKVAAAYRPERFLIGPRLFPHFLTVLQVVLPIVAALALIDLVPSFRQIDITFESVFTNIVKAVSEMLASLVSAFGSIVLLFTGLQWTVPEFKITIKEWDPRSLLKLKPRDQIDKADTIVDLFASLAAIIVFNFFPQVISINLSLDQPGTPNIPILSQAFFSYLPALTFLWGLTAVLDVVLLAKNCWEDWTRWSAFGLRILAITVAVIILSGPSLIAVNAEALTTTGMNISTANILINLLEQGIIVALAIYIIVNVFRLILHIIRLTGRNLPEALNRI